MTTALIFLPIAAALLVWLLPMPPVLDRLLGLDRGTLSLIAMVGALGLFIGTAAWGFEYGAGGLQLGQRWDWFEELGISYHVGLFGFSLWLIGLTLVVGTAAIAYGVWSGRERPRAYYPLMLLLVGALVGVFASQDLLLFYAFFEAMLIPIYLLVGVWGGPNRVKATITFVIYTMAGSLLMLASVIAFGVTQGTFDLLDSGTSDNKLVMLGFLAAFAVKAPLFPFHGWLRQAYTESTPEVAAMLSGVVSKAAVYGLVWIVLRHFPGPVADLRGFILVVASLTLLYGSIVAFRQPDARGVIAYSSMGQMGLITLGIFAANDLGLDGAILHSINHGLVSAALFLLAALIEKRTGSGLFASLGGMARGRPVLATLVMVVGMFTLAVPGSTNFAAEFSILAGVFRRGWGYAAVGAFAIVLAAMYALRLISAVLHAHRGRAVEEGATDLGWSEIGLVAPLVAILVALSVWPASISGNAFPRDEAQQTIEAVGP
jgi:NADH-quinone oxidoreductase subunit M